MTSEIKQTLGSGEIPGELDSAVGETLTLEISLRVSDPSALIDHVRDIRGMLPTSLEQAVCEGVCNPSSPPATSGFEVVARTASFDDAGVCTLQIEARVFDSEQVTAEARECYDACWGNEEWEPANLREALTEILVGSNANPSPADIGFKIVELNALCDPPARTTSRMRCP